MSGVVLRLPLLLWWVGRRGPVSTGSLVWTLAPFIGLALLVHLVARGTLALVADHGLVVQVLAPLGLAGLSLALALCSMRVGQI